MKKLFLLLLLLLSISVTAQTNTIRMVQADKTFLGNISDKQASEVFDDENFSDSHKVKELKAKVGDSIFFINRDEVAHNVSGSMKEVNEFDVKIQEPGAKNDRKIQLTKKGDYVIQCAIHPKMRFVIKVD